MALHRKRKKKEVGKVAGHRSAHRLDKRRRGMAAGGDPTEGQPTPLGGEPLGHIVLGGPKILDFVPIKKPPKPK